MTLCNTRREPRDVVQELILETSRLNSIDGMAKVEKKLRGELEGVTACLNAQPTRERLVARLQGCRNNISGQKIYETVKSSFSSKPAR